MSNNPPKPLDWTAEDSDEDNSEELRRQLGSPSKVKVENDGEFDVIGVWNLLGAMQSWG